MPTRYIHFVQILRDGHWVDFEKSYDDLDRARRRAAEIRRYNKIPVQIVSLKSTKESTS